MKKVRQNKESTSVTSSSRNNDASWQRSAGGSGRGGEGGGGVDVGGVGGAGVGGPHEALGYVKKLFLVQFPQ